MSVAIEPHSRRGASDADRTRPIRLLIVDDSAVARAMLSRMIGGHPEFEIAATVAGAEAALSFLKSARVDIIMLDIEMPGMDGLTALPQILETSAGAHVLVVSSAAAVGAAATMRALTLGATDTLPKPGAGAFGGRFADTLVERLLKIGRVDAARRDGAAAPLPPLRLRALSSAPIECLAIGASTGGLRALSELLRALDTTFDAPILITQHLPAVFMSFFAAQIEEISGRRTRVAGDRDRLPRGEILVAPGDGHLCVQRSAAAVRITILRARASSGCLPSVDPMLESVGATYGAAGVGIVLTGMGRDGTLGAASMARDGGDILVQDRDSSVVWGMPGSIAAAGLASAVLKPRQIAELVMGRGAA